MDVWAIANRNKGEHIWMAQAKSGDDDFGNTICKDYVGIMESDGSLDGNGMECEIIGIYYLKRKDLRIIDGVIHRYPATDLDENGKVVYNYYPRWYANKVANHEVYDSEEIGLMERKFIKKVKDGVWQN